MAKTKMSVTVDRALVEALDERTTEGRSRSELVEVALRAWLRARRRQEQEAAMERYYLDLTRAERDEDAAWAAGAARAAAGAWE